MAQNSDPDVLPRYHSHLQRENWPPRLPDQSSLDPSTDHTTHVQSLDAGHTDHQSDHSDTTSALTNQNWQSPMHWSPAIWQSSHSSSDQGRRPRCEPQLHV